MEKDKIIFRLQHLLGDLGYGCKCYNFITNKDCPWHSDKVIHLSSNKNIECNNCNDFGIKEYTGNGYCPECGKRVVK